MADLKIKKVRNKYYLRKKEINGCVGCVTTGASSLCSALGSCVGYIYVKYTSLKNILKKL